MPGAKCETFLCLIMPRKKKNGDQPIGVGLTSKQMKRKKPINTDMLRDVDPLQIIKKLCLIPMIRIRT